MALSDSDQTSPYFFTNLGRKRPGGKLPVMSICTRTWPAQPLPAPMPMVGMDSRSVDDGGDLGRHGLDDHGEAAGVLEGQGVLEDAGGRRRRLALHLEAAEGVLALRVQADVAVPRECRPLVILRMVGAISRPPSSS